MSDTYDELRMQANDEARGDEAREAAIRRMDEDMGEHLDEDPSSYAPAATHRRFLLRLLSLSRAETTEANERALEGARLAFAAGKAADAAEARLAEAALAEAEATNALLQMAPSLVLSGCVAMLRKRADEEERDAEGQRNAFTAGIPFGAKMSEHAASVLRHLALEMEAGER